MGIYILLTRKLGIVLEIASPAAIETSILWNFIWNNASTFKKRKPRVTWLQRLVAFHVVSSAAARTNYSILLLLVRVFGLWDILANLAGIAVGTLFNYLMNSLWTWKEVRSEISGHLFETHKVKKICASAQQSAISGQKTKKNIRLEITEHPNNAGRLCIAS